MSDSGKRPIETSLTAVSVVADFLSIAAFLGLQENHVARVTLVISLATIGFVTGIVVAWRALRLAFSVRGSYYPSQLHRTRLYVALLSVVGSIALGYVGIQLV
ncbi:hypothetical protein [Micropruina glycogenica]|uniref:hypothetical protein n=1 Tax=Micropruina glycogenica TaxID=75385 RepID=UPI001319C115|nr:hypothetical protein [Micropruina glycogenica]